MVNLSGAFAKGRVSWKIYQDIGLGLTAAGEWGFTEDAYLGNYGDNSLLYFHQYSMSDPAIGTGQLPA